MQIYSYNLFDFSVGGIALLVILAWLNRWWQERAYHLQGKVVLLTGGSRGLGLVMARQLVDAGAKVAICARDEAELERARLELEQRKGESQNQIQSEIVAFPCDVTRQDQVERVVRQVKEHFGAIDILINDAGADIVGPMEEQTLENYDEMIKLHFWAPLYTTYAVLPEMQARQQGRIVNIASIGGKTPFSHMLAYCASKFALVGLSEGMRMELAKDNIAVTTVCPGMIHSGFTDHTLMKGQSRKEYAWFSIGVSLPLVSASAEKVARAAIAGCRRGAAEVIVPLPFWFAARFYALFPELNTHIFGIVNRFLPKPGGVGKTGALGKDSHSAWAPSVLTTLSDRAAQQNNEFPDSQAAAAQAAYQTEDASEAMASRD